MSLQVTACQSLSTDAVFFEFFDPPFACDYRPRPTRFRWTPIGRCRPVCENGFAAPYCFELLAHCTRDVVVGCREV